MTTEKNPRQNCRRVVCVLVPRFNMMSLLSLLEPLRIANYLSSDPLYAYEFRSADGPEITASNGMTIAAGDLPEKLTGEDLVLLVASWSAEQYKNPKLLSWLRRQERLGTHLCAVEMAPYIFARAGLLAGRKATTHWSYLPGFQELYPDVLCAEQLYTRDGRIMTCAGSSAGFDFMLDMIRKDHGASLIGEIAENIIHHPVRSDVAPQRRPMGRDLDELPPGVSAAIDLMDAQISEPLAVPDLARRVGISQRQLERQFKQAMGCSVVQFGLLIRLQHARVLLISTDLSVRDVSAASGFNSLSHFAYAFRNCFGRRPSEYRQDWPDHKDAPTWPGTLSKYLETLRIKQRMRDDRAKLAKPGPQG